MSNNLSSSNNHNSVSQSYINFTTSNSNVTQTGDRWHGMPNFNSISDILNYPNDNGLQTTFNNTTSFNNTNTNVNNIDVGDLTANIVANSTSDLQDNVREQKVVSLIHNKDNSELKKQIAENENFRKATRGGTGFGGKLWFKENIINLRFNPDDSPMLLLLKNMGFNVDCLASGQTIQFKLPNNIKDEDKAEIVLRFKMNPSDAFLYYYNKSDVGIDLIGTSVNNKIITLKSNNSSLTDLQTTKDIINTLSSGVKLVKAQQNINYFCKELSDKYKNTDGVDNSSYRTIIKAFNDIASTIINFNVNKQNTTDTNNQFVNNIFNSLYQKNKDEQITLANSTPQQRIEVLNYTKSILKRIYNNNDNEIIKGFNDIANDGDIDYNDENSYAPLTSLFHIIEQEKQNNVLKYTNEQQQENENNKQKSNEEEINLMEEEEAGEKEEKKQTYSININTSTAQKNQKSLGQSSEMDDLNNNAENFEKLQKQQQDQIPQNQPLNNKQNQNDANPANNTKEKNPHPKINGSNTSPGFF